MQHKITHVTRAFRAQVTDSLRQGTYAGIDYSWTGEQTEWNLPEGVCREHMFDRFHRSIRVSNRYHTIDSNLIPTARSL
jgi:hypothetical protein